MTLRLRVDRGPVAGFGERLALAERLIRAGARPAVVNEALETRGALRILVTRLHREARHPDRPRGPLPSDLHELLGTRAMRLEGSAFLSAWDHLRAAGDLPGRALLEAWETTDAVFARRPRARRFTIDHAWVLARERSRLVVRRCERCRAAWYECPRGDEAALVPMRGSAGPRGGVAPTPGLSCPEAPRGEAWPSEPSRFEGVSGEPPRPGSAPDLRCPHCHPPALATARERPHRAQPRPPRPARGGARPPLSDELATLADRFIVAEALISAGARLPVVAHLTSLPSGGVLRQLYIEVAGERPRQGALPQLGAHVLATSRLRMEASVLVVTASRLLRAGMPAEHALLGAWRIYHDLFGDIASFDINAASLVVRARRHPDFHLVTCPRCRTEQIELRSDLLHRRCPVCRSLRSASRGGGLATAGGSASLSATTPPSVPAPTLAPTLLPAPTTPSATVPTPTPAGP